MTWWPGWPWLGQGMGMGAGEGRKGELSYQIICRHYQAHVETMNISKTVKYFNTWLLSICSSVYIYMSRNFPFNTIVFINFLTILTLVVSLNLQNNLKPNLFKIKIWIKVEIWSQTWLWAVQCLYTCSLIGNIQISRNHLTQELWTRKF